MWAFQLQTGEYIDLPDNFSLALELTNQVFTNDPASLPGSFSFPAEVPLTGHNMRIFARPHLPESANPTKTIDNVTVLAAGMPIMQGRLRVLGATQEKVRFTIVATPVSDLKNIQLNELDTGGNRSLIPFTVPGLMSATCNRPEDFDFAFLPVYTAQPWFPVETLETGDWQNKYDSATQQFLETSGSLTPFLKVEYLISRLFAAEKNGYTFQNAFQMETELRRLYLYNNVDMRVTTPSGLAFPSSFSLNKHIPKIKATDFLKKVAAMFGLGLYVNYFEKTIRLAPVKNTLMSDPAHDWTRYAVADPVKDTENTAPGLYRFDAFEDLPADAPAVHLMRKFATMADLVTALNAPGGITEEWVYSESNNLVWNTKWNFNLTELNGLTWGAFPHVDSGVGEEYNPGISPLPGGTEYYRTRSGISRFVLEEGQYRFDTKEAPLALMLYRGRQRTDRFPCAGNTPNFSLPLPGQAQYNITTGSAGTIEAQAKYGLDWDSDQGLYNTFHAEWNRVLRNGSHVTQTFLLPAAMVARYSFEQKVRVGSMDYVLKKIRLGKISQGHILCSVQMVSVL